MLKSKSASNIRWTQNKSNGNGYMDQRISSLDGTRAISITLVITAHLKLTEGWPLAWRLDYGNLGVRTFFVISGFLITSLLLKEINRTGSVNLKDFYVRRTFRIMPAYYIYIGVIALLIPTGWVAATYSDLLPALAYYANYDHPNLALGMTWSLSVEEQFYLLWPATLFFLGLRRAKIACFVLLFTAPVFRLLYEWHWWPLYSKFASESVCDTLATGCLLALFRERLWSISLYRRLVESKLAFLVLPAAILLMAAQPPMWCQVTIGLSLLNFGIAIALDRCMRFPDAGVAKFLNITPVVWIGTISYSLYLWQQIFAFNDHLPTPVKLAYMLGMAILSYYVIERPFLAMRRRLQAQPVMALDPSVS
jgi:peptidoglycan/LPS O-acetylase OafA/YrhL